MFLLYFFVNKQQGSDLNPVYFSQLFHLVYYKATAVHAQVPNYYCMVPNLTPEMGHFLMKYAEISSYMSLVLNEIPD